MDEDNFDYEELKQAVINEMEKTYTVEEALKAKEEEDKLFNESFDVLWKSYHSTQELRSEAIKKLRIIKYKTILSNILLLMIRYDIKDEVKKVVSIINSAQNDINLEKKLLNEIYISLEKLQAHHVSSCNYELANLIALIYERTETVYDYACDELGATASRLRGFDTITATKNLEKKEELEKDINEYTLKLGLGK